MTLRRIAAVAAAFAALAASPAASAALLTRPEASLLHAMNAARAAHGLGPLRADGRLEQAARFHSRQMLATGVFAHGAFLSRMLRFDVTGRFAGENLAWGVGPESTADSIVAAWLASREHRANLLRPGFDRVGIATLSGAFEGYAAARVVTVDFAG